MSMLCRLHLALAFALALRAGLQAGGEAPPDPQGRSDVFVLSGDGLGHGATRCPHCGTARTKPNHQPPGGECARPGTPALQVWEGCKTGLAASPRSHPGLTGLKPAVGSLRPAQEALKVHLERLVPLGQRLRLRPAALSLKAQRRGKSPYSAWRGVGRTPSKLTLSAEHVGYCRGLQIRWDRLKVVYVLQSGRGPTAPWGPLIDGVELESSGRP